MEVKNYTYAAFIKKAIPLFLMMLFVNVGWGQTTTTYTFNTKAWGTTTSSWTSGADGLAFQADRGIQISTGTTGAFGNSPISYSNISSIKVNYSTNASKGKGTIRPYAVAGTSAISQSGTAIANAQNVTVTGGITLRSLTFSPLSAISGYVQIYVTCTENSIYIYSVEITYSNVSAPTVTTTTASNITTTSALFGGNVTATNGSAIIANGTVYSAKATNANPQLLGTGVTDLATSTPGAGAGDFSTNSGVVLSSNVQYSYNAYATNATGTSYGTVKDFWTLANSPLTPAVSDAQVTSLSVSLNATDGNPANTEYAIQETTTGDYVQADGTLGVAAVWNIAGASGWNSPITVGGLTANTSYTFQVKARNGANVETGFSPSTMLSTLPNTAPTIESNTLTAFSTTCLNAVATVQILELTGSNLNSNPVTVGPLDGFTFSTDAGVTFVAQASVSADGNGDLIEEVVVKFTPSAVQSYNGNIEIVGGGANAIFTSVVAEGINTPVTITTGASDVLTANSATLNGIVTQGCSAIAAYGMEYSTVNNFANGAGISVESTNVNAGNFTVNLSGLQSNTTYYYKGFATDATGTVYGNQNTFTTNAIEDPTAIAATLVTQTGFTANWNAVAGASGYELDVYEASTAIISSTETFTGIGGGTSTSYIDRTWTGNGGVSWTGYKSRTDQVVTASNDAITLRDEAGAYLESGAITGTLQSISFDVKQVYSGSGGTLTLKIRSGIDFTQITTVGTYSYNTAVSNKTALISPNIDGPFKIVLENSISTRAVIDNLKIDRLESSITSVTGYPDLSVVGTSKVITGLTPNTEYFYKVRAKDANSTSINSNEIAVTTLDDKTTYTAGAWTNGAPTADLDAIINDVFTTTGNLTAKSLTINAGKVFTVASGHTLTVVNDLVNNAGATGIVIESDGVLLQTATTANTAAFATVKRNSTSLFRQDYTLWSSPVVGQNLRNFSPLTLFNRFSTYNTAAGTNGAYRQEIFTTEDMDTKVFESAKGYLIRMPNDWVQSPSAPQSFVGNFSGNLNNGDVSIPLSGANTRFNLVGNPYPSPISMGALFAANGHINRTLYFWRKKNSANTAGSGYATVNEFGSVSADGEINGTTLTHIKTGQGFFVQATNAAPAPLVFNNGMRANASSIFFKSAMDTPTEAHRFWLNLADANAVVGQTLVGYATDATQGVDSGIDAVYFNDAPVALTSIINNNEYIIQGRSLPFTTNDIVPLGFKTDVAGSYTISLPNFDGLFADNQDIYLNDKATHTLHNLKSGSYTFTTQPGVFNTRFEVQYNTTLSTNNPIMDANTILIGVKNQQININAGSVTMHKIELIDVTGRVIYTKEQVNASTATIDNLAVSNQMLIVRITTAENGVVSQKIIF